MTIVEIRTLAELAAEIGVDHPCNIQRALFKSTRCGIVYNVLDDTAGVSVCGYAEGADAECIPHELRFPFASDVFWNAVEDADTEGCDMWHEWNDDDDNTHD
jgi:hypothetical protein